MKKILIYILLTIYIYANEDIKELEGIFFKMGIEAFLKDFENEKNITSNQQKMIDFLSSKVYDHEILLKRISQDKDKDKKQNNINLNNNDLLLIGKNHNNLEELYKKIDKMEKEIAFYKNLSIKNEKKLIELII
ncbi:MAG: hypothetical protein U9Q30_07095 [Campylobacterota bacterium]|nr:hypothetical protein [Campylobacterota bacterium]